MFHEKDTYDKQVMEFVTVAVQFCNLLENANNLTQADFTDKLAKILPLMYLKALLLPDNDDFVEAYMEDFVDEENYNIVRNNVALLLGRFDDYLDVFVEDMRYSDKPVLSTMSENLADIYQDVKNFVMVFKVEALDEVVQEAVAQLKETFRYEWGQKLVNVMRPLHEIRYQTMYSQDEE